MNGKRFPAQSRDRLCSVSMHYTTPYMYVQNAEILTRRNILNVRETNTGPCLSNRHTAFEVVLVYGGSFETFFTRLQGHCACSRDCTLAGDCACHWFALADSSSLVRHYSSSFNVYIGGLWRDRWGSSYVDASQFPTKSGNQVFLAHVWFDVAGRACR